VKLHVCFFGPEAVLHLRRDFLLALKLGLETLGHDVSISGARLDPSRLNLVVGAYFLRTRQIHALAALGRRVAHVNTEIIANDMLNHQPDKVDFHGAFLPALQSAAFVWDLVADNLREHERHGTRAAFLRWGWHPGMEEIVHRREKELDWYFFGSLTPRRREVVAALEAAGLAGHADHSCPYFVRNDAIARARVQLNVIQDDRYSHVNVFRIAYLANNRAAIVSERETDPVGYLDAVRIADRSELPAVVAELARGGGWRELGEAIHADFRAKPSLAEGLERALDLSLAAGGVAAPGADDAPWRAWIAASPEVRSHEARVEREHGTVRRALRRVRRALHPR
jgi:hypothetical protein